MNDLKDNQPIRLDLAEGEKKSTYEELEKEKDQLKETIKGINKILRGKEEAWELEKKHYKSKVKDLEKEIEKLKEVNQEKPNSAIENPAIPFNKLNSLLEKNNEELGELQKQFAIPKQFLNSWRNVFGNKKPLEIKETFDREKKEYLDRIKQLEKLLLNRKNKNISPLRNQKKETKLCEICQQIKTDNFKYSRVSAQGFNTYHLYRICSFCQKTTQMVVNNDKDINPENNLFTK